MRALFATDGSRASGAALSMIEALADREAVEISVLSVSAVRQDGLAESLFTPDVMSAIDERVHATAEEAAARLRDAKFQVSAEVAEGNAGKEIVKKVHSERAELAILGAGQHAWVEKLLLGRTSTYVLHHCPASVMIVHEARRRPEPVRVLVATDGSPVAGTACDALRRFAGADRCVITVFSVAETAARMLPSVTQPGARWPGVEYPDDFLAEQMERSHEAAKSIAEGEAGRFRSAGFEVDEEIAEGGPPARIILQEAHRQHHDLVVVGSSGLGPVTGTVLGSTGDAVARNTRAALVGRSQESAGSYRTPEESETFRGL